MLEWIYAVQKLVDFIDNNTEKNLSLEEISRQVGYSPYYCSVQFHRIAGTTIKSYMAKRRLYMATVAVHDTDKRIIDIALDYGYFGQNSLTRAFKDAYGCTPAAYRKNPVPIPISMSKIYISLENQITGGHKMSNTYLMELKKIDDNKHLIGMVSVDEILRFGYEAGLNENSKVLDLTYGYGTILKVWSEAFGISGVVVESSQRFAEIGRERIKKAGVDDKIKIVHDDKNTYKDAEKYDLVVCSVGQQIPSNESLEYIKSCFSLGERFLKDGGMLAYIGTYSKIPNPPQELIDFEGELLQLSELNNIFRELGYYLICMAGDTDAMWEHYAVNGFANSLEQFEKIKLKENPNDKELQQSIDHWNRMYFDYRRPYQRQALFGLVKL
ncbi:MAG: AraC family transcriptional regulator [Oscillospiraceae bacterium]|nr:AraC family transcriptional regulator [Oscillospiraceae bacterium]